MRSHFLNLVHTCPDGMEAMLVGTGGQGSSISFFVSNSMWCKHFVIRWHHRMGNNWMPDKPLTAPIMRACFIILKSKWESSQREIWKFLGITTTACSILAGNYGALRGEEAISVDIGLLRKHWIEATNHEVKHIPIMLVGRFKQVNGVKKYYQPLAFKPSQE